MNKQEVKTQRVKRAAGVSELRCVFLSLVVNIFLSVSCSAVWGGELGEDLFVQRICHQLKKVANI